MILRPRPTWQSGYADSAERARYPSLWHRLVGAWPTGLGRTGLRMVDVSGYGAHGAGSNMEPGDWLLDRGILGVDFGGTDEKNATSERTRFLFTTSDFSVSCWMRTSTSAFMAVIGMFRDTWEIGTNTDNAQIHFQFGGTIRNYGTSINDGAWHHVVCMRRGTATYEWTDGVNADFAARHDGAPASLGTGGTHTLTFGSRTTNNLWYTGQLANVFIWDRLLVPSEILTLYRNPLAPVELSYEPLAYPEQVAAAIRRPVLRR